MQLLAAPSGSHDTTLPNVIRFPVPPRVVGLSGLAGCGKSTVASYLVRAHGYTRVRFADPLKNGMRAAFGLTDEEIEGKLKELPCDKLEGKTPRFGMQQFGTEFGRNTLGEDLWVNAWKRLVADLPPYARVVADDVRFPNEAGAIWSLGGFIFKIERPGQQTITTSGHASETQQARIEYDGKIINDGSIADLERAVDYRIIRGEPLPPLTAKAA